VGTRQQKLAKQLQKDLGAILDAASRQLFPSVLITVMEVRMTPDLGLAKVYVSIFNAKEDKDIVEWLNKERGQIRYKLAAVIKNQIRKMPELAFYSDETHDKANRIDEILSQITYSDKPRDEEE